MIKIYIHPFWAGVLLTLIVEVVIVMVVAFIDMRNMEDCDEDEKHS